MLEKYAKKKLCPFFGPASIVAAASAPRDLSKKARDDMVSIAYCRTGDCMAWVPTDKECINAAQPGNPLYRDPPKYGDAGYCGLMNTPRR